MRSRDCEHDVSGRYLVYVPNEPEPQVVVADTWRLREGCLLFDKRLGPHGDDYMDTVVMYSARGWLSVCEEE